MTSTITTLNIDDEILSSDQLDQLPTGAVIRADRNPSDGTDRWTKLADGRWFDSTTSDEHPSDAFAFDEGALFLDYLPVRIPAIDEAITATAQLDALPIGAGIRANESRDVSGSFIKGEDERWRYSDSTGSLSTSGFQANAFPLNLYYLHSLPEPAIEEPVIEWPAMDHANGHNLRDLSVDGADVGSAFHWHNGGFGNGYQYLRTTDGWVRRSISDCDANQEENVSGVSVPEALVSTLSDYAWDRYVPVDEPVTAQYTQAEVDTMVAQAQAAATATAVARVNEQWAEKMRVLNEQANEFADDQDLCYRYDEFMDEHGAKLGLHGRNQDYDVAIRVTVIHRRTVNARSADAAYEEAISDTSFRPGTSCTLYGEDVEIESVENMN